MNLILTLLLEETLLQKVSNHPVHILNPEGDISPSAFIPFCFFGNKMNNLGEKIVNFTVPVCNVFAAKNWKDQLCYELNLNLLKVEDDINHQLKDGILLVIDFNEERQFDKDDNIEKVEKVRNYIYENQDNTVQVHIDTIGKKPFLPFHADS